MQGAIHYVCFNCKTFFYPSLWLEALLPYPFRLQFFRFFRERRNPVTLSEVAHSIFYAPQYAAIELGYFEEEGINLTLVNAGGADKVMTSLISGDARSVLWVPKPASMYTRKVLRILPLTSPS